MPFGCSLDSFKTVLEIHKGKAQEKRYLFVLKAFWVFSEVKAEFLLASNVSALLECQ